MTHRSANRIFWLTVMGSSMLWAIPQTATAQEAPAAQFRPIKTWEVGNKGAPGECIIQTEFNNGFILQFEGASNWVQALNVNFRQNIFEANKTYSVNMSVPGQTTFQTQATGVKANILAVPVKTQKELYKAMRETAVLDMDVEGNAFRFYMTGFTDGAAQFERCMGGQSPQSQTQMVTALPPVAPPAPIAASGDADEETIVVRLSDEQKAAMEQEFMINESIEMEQQEAGLVDVEEIIPPAPAPAVEKPTPAPVIEEDIKVELTSIDSDPPVAKMPEGNQSHIRLSDQLARQLDANPDLAAIDNQPVARPEPIEREPVVIASPDMDDDMTSPVGLSSRPDAKPDGLEIPEEIIVQTEEKAQESPMPEPAEVEAAAAPVPEPVAETLEPAPAPAVTSTAVKLPDDAPEIVKQMFAQKQIVTPETAATAEPAMPKAEIEPIEVEAIEVTMVEEPREVVAIEAAEPVMPEPLVVNMEDEAPAAAPSMPASSMTTEDMLAEPAQKVTSQTPSMQVTKETTTAEVDFTNVEPSAARDYSAADLARIATLEQKIDALMAENKALNDELNLSLREGEQERMSISSENWNLEKATMLYNEAERQNKTLGLQIQKERAQHEMEKKELEAMLFDPEVTSQEQLARLSALEQQLAAANAKIKALQAQIGTQ